MKAGIVGATGYLGAELLRHLAHHPHLEVAALQADSSAGRPLGDSHPGLPGALAEIVVDSFDLDALLACDVVFVAVPSGASQNIVPQLVDRVRLTVDLGEWWFNLRPSNTEPLLRLNLEAADRAACDAHTAEVLELFTERNTER